MPTNSVEHVLAVGNKLGEGPIWHVEEEALYWVDIQNKRYHRLKPATGVHAVFDVDFVISAIGFRASGGLVMATGEGLALCDPAEEALRVVADPEAHETDTRFNDGAVDRQGRFWAGTMGPDLTHNLYRMDPDASVHPMETGIGTSNGIGWSPDDTTMYYTDSARRVIYAYDFDPVSGDIANRRPFVRVPEGAGVPDGLTVDSEGYVWSARWDGWQVVRYDPDGQVVREVRLPVQRPTSCALGGPGLDELYITSAWTGLTEAQRRAQPRAGDLFRVRVGVPGLPEPVFLG